LFAVQLIRMGSPMILKMIPMVISLYVLLLECLEGRCLCWLNVGRTAGLAIKLINLVWRL